MDGAYTIGELARAGGVPISTVRYYERAGLLSPEGRTGGNYRSYSKRSLARLRFIRSAQVNGFTLDDVRVLLQFQDGALSPCGEVQTLIEARLLDLEERFKQLRDVRAVLRSSLDACHRGESTGRCQVLDNLARGKAAGKGRKARKPGKARLG
jgi:MerR family mercuric resistance operon transcriptional regulator